MASPLPIDPSKSERITLRTQCVNGREYHVTTRYVVISREELIRRWQEITRAVAMSIPRRKTS